jgi:hypothetical protein
LADGETVLATPALLRLEHERQGDPYDNIDKQRTTGYDSIPADAMALVASPGLGTDYDHVPGRSGPVEGETAPVLIEADDGSDAGGEGAYLTPRALLEPEWLHGNMTREQAEAMVMVSRRMQSRQPGREEASGLGGEGGVAGVGDWLTSAALVSGG